MTRTSRYILLVMLLVVAAEPAALAQETRGENPAPGDYIDHEGRYKLLATTTMFGAIEGALIPLAVGSESERAVSSLALAGASAGFFVPFMLTEDHPVTEARATFTLYGGSQGLAHGFLLAFLLGVDNISGEGAASLLALTTAAELGLGYSLPGRYDLEAGTGEMLGFGSAYGIWSGYLVAALLTGTARPSGPPLGSDPLGPDPFGPPSAGVAEITVDDRTAGGLGLAGSLVGNFAAWRVSRAQDYTQGDARVLARTGFLGIETSTTVLTLIDDEGPVSYSLLYLTGTVGGLGAGVLLTRGRDFTRSEANIIFLGTVAGRLFTWGIGYGLEADRKVNSVLQLAGSLAGFAFTYSTYGDEASRRTSPEVGMRLSPTLLFAHDNDGTNQSGNPVPGVNLSVTF